jgi:hypothetical protein
MYRLLVGKLEGNKPLGRSKHRWVDNIRIDLGEVGWSYVDWIGLAQDRNRWRALVNSVLNLRVQWPNDWCLSSSAQLHTVLYIYIQGAASSLPFSYGNCHIKLTN